MFSLNGHKPTSIRELVDCAQLAHHSALQDIATIGEQSEFATLTRLWELRLLAAEIEQRASQLVTQLGDACDRAMQVESPTRPGEWPF